MDESAIALYGFGILFGGLAIWALILFIRAFKKIKDSKSWPKTMGLITHSSVESGVGSGSVFVFSPKVIYEYEVGGKRYTSSHLAIIEHNTASEDLAREKAEKYAPGQHVEVYYDPEKPTFAVLNR
jgi:hypothetical protein